jgi:predicted RNase H-like nuclease (RuvC/YqgF family)
MIVFDENSKQQLIDLNKSKNIILEGNIAKVIDTSDDKEFKEYIDNCISKDKEVRRRRLEMTKQIQTQNKELSDLNLENQRMMVELQTTLTNVEESKQQIESQNKELIDWKEDNERLTTQLQGEMVKSEVARVEAEKSKESALNDLDILQKKTQTELIGTVVKVALVVILSVGVITTGMYCVAMYTGKDTQIIGSTWSNMFGILLTNAFSIIGTIMGVKYASEKK